MVFKLIVATVILVCVFAKGEDMDYNKVHMQPPVRAFNQQYVPVDKQEKAIEDVIY